MPFTSPLLSGARVRNSEHLGNELVVPSPSGGRGVYVLNWPGVKALCNPTIHDTMLFRQFGFLTAIDPSNIREAALEVALNGTAGQQAATAAKAAVARDESERALAHFLLSVRLLEQLDPNGPKVKSLAEWTPEYDRRIGVALNRIAPSLGRPVAQLAASLVEIGNVLAPLGIPSVDRSARIPRVIFRLKEAHDDLSQWLQADAGNDLSGLGQAIMVAMRRAYQSGRAVLDKIRAMAADPVTLLKRQTNNASAVMAMIGRCGWLMDGWERVSLLWLSARTTASRRAALLEMAPMVPVLPREVVEWTDMPIHPAAMEQACRVTSRDDTWRTGSAAFALIERNEKLLIMSS